MLSEAVLRPMEVGLNVIVRVQLVPPLTMRGYDTPQVPPVTVNCDAPVPVVVIPDRVSGSAPVLFTVTVCDTEVVPTS